jgi:hypothetical protein
MHNSGFTKMAGKPTFSNASQEPLQSPNPLNQNQ